MFNMHGIWRQSLFADLNLKSLNACTIQNGEINISLLTCNFDHQNQM